MFSKKFSSTIKRRKRAFLSIIVIFALTLGLGYSVFGSNLNFLGSLSLNAKTLNVYVKSVSPTSGSVTPTSPAKIVGNERKEVDFSTNLPILTDYYEVSTVIRNGGKSKAYYIDYELKVYDSNGDEIQLPSELECTVLNADGTSIVKNHELNAQAEETFKIKFNYKSGASLPSQQPVYTIQVVFNYDLEPVIPKLYDVIKTETDSGSGLAAKYTGSHNDTLDNSGTQDIYYYTGDVKEKFNVKLGNMCWQMLRTTDTGGVKLIYNGEYDEINKCNDSRGTHKGVTSSNTGVWQNLATPYMYGDTYSYDLSTGEFTLENTSIETWSDSTANSLVGKYTCKTLTNTCTTLYVVKEYNNSFSGYVSNYTIGDIEYSHIGTIPYNVYSESPAMVGYMFNKFYYGQGGAADSGTLKGNDVTYSNGVYTLTNTQKAKDNSHHYTCNNTTGTCATVRYYYFNNYYIELTGGTKIEDAVNEMLYVDNVNTRNSAIKTLIEEWYKQNMLSYTSNVEDIVYCNSREQTNANNNGWYKNGSFSVSMYFSSNSNIPNLYCRTLTDKFTTTNDKAKTVYPVGLITYPEMYLLNDTNSTKTGYNYFLGTPYCVYYDLASVRSVNASGSYDDKTGVGGPKGVRPAISLKPGTEYTSGTGTMNDPYVVKLD